MLMARVHFSPRYRIITEGTSIAREVIWAIQQQRDDFTLQPAPGMTLPPQKKKKKKKKMVAAVGYISKISTLNYF